MAAITSNSSFVDTKAARVVAACIAIVIAIVLISVWSEDFSRLTSGNQTNPLPDSTSATTETTVANPALAACFEQRIGDVDKMKEDGILSDAQYASFRARAESLCRQQNPTQN